MTDFINALASVLTILTAVDDTYQKLSTAALTNNAIAERVAKFREIKLTVESYQKKMEPVQSTWSTQTPQPVIDALNQCKEDLQELGKILDRSPPGDNATTSEHMMERFRQFMKSSRVDSLIKSTSGKLKFLVQLSQMNSPSSEFNQTLDGFVQRLKVVEESVSATNVTTYNNSNYGGGQQNYNSGSGSFSPQSFSGRSRQITYTRGEHHHYHNETGKSLKDLFLLSLKYPEMDTRLEEIRDQEIKTCEWAFETPGRTGGSRDDGNGTMAHHSKPNIAEWFRSGQRIYVVNGKPGSGKSTFMKFLYRDKRTNTLLSQWSGRRKVYRLFHSFWGLSNEPAARNWKGLIANVITQLINFESPKITALIRRTQQNSKYADWSLHSLCEVFTQIVQSSNSSYCLFIDGLDEVKATEQIQDILIWIRNLPFQTMGKCKICLATRGTVHTEILGHEGMMEIHKFTKNDIQVYVHHRLKISDALKLHQGKADFEERYNDIVNLITEKAEGVWIWVYLVLKQIEQYVQMDRSLEKVWEVIRSLPKELDDLYRESLASSRRNWKHSEEQRAMILACGTQFPIPSFQLSIALNEKERQRYLQTCQIRDDSSIANELKFDRLLFYRLTGCLAEVYQDSAFEHEFRTASERFGVGQLRGKIALHADSRDDMDLKRYWLLQPWRTERVRFIHRTVYEFLVEEGEIDPRPPSLTQSILAESMLVCFIEDVLPLTQNTIKRLCESLDSIQGNDLHVIDVINETCQRLVEARRHQQTQTTTERLPDPKNGKWLGLLIESFQTEPRDFFGLLFSCESVVGAMYVLQRYGLTWSNYYKGHLVLCTIVAFENGYLNLHPVQKILPQLLKEGADLNVRFSSSGSSKARPSTKPDTFRTESCISRLLASTFVELTSFVWNSDAGLEEGDLILSNAEWVLNLLASHCLDTITTTLFIFVDETCDSIVIDLWWAPLDLDNPTSNEEISSSNTDGGFEWCENGTVVVFRGHEIWTFLSDMIRKHGRKLLYSDSAKQDFLQHCVMVPSISYLSVLERATEMVFWMPCPDSQLQSFIKAMISGNKDEYVWSGQNAIENAGKSNLLDGQSVPVKDVALDVSQNGLPLPFDSNQSVAEDKWHDAGTLREYFAEVQGESSPRQTEVVPVSWEIYQ